MGDYFADPTRPVARKPHRCIACYGMIPKGEQHWQQTGFYEGSAFRNRYHAECWDYLRDDGFEDGFEPGSVPPPERLTKEVTA
jgi:hypothetical protein